MKNLKFHLPVIIFLLFEFAVGVILFTEPERFTKTVIYIFGALLIVNSVIFAVRYLLAKKRGDDPSILTLIVAIASLILGVLCLVLVNSIFENTVIRAIIYGVFLIVSGVYKIKAYFDIRNAGMEGSVFMIAAAVVSIILGTVIVILQSKETMWNLTGGLLIGEAVFDLFALIMTLRAGKKSE